MTYNFDNINKFFEDLMNGKNAKYNMLYVYGAYERECERVKQERKIRDSYGTVRDIKNIFIVNEDIVIVERLIQQESCYFTWVGEKCSNWSFPTFEQALLCAVSIKLTGREDATEWMWKLVGGENNP